MHKRFAELEVLQNNNWEEPQDGSKAVKKVIKVKKSVAVKVNLILYVNVTQFLHLVQKNVTFFLY